MEVAMRKTIVLVGVLAFGFSTPALAASYYVVQDTKTQKCSVVSKKPSAKSKITALVGPGTAYRSKQEAATAMGAMTECKAA